MMNDISQLEENAETYRIKAIYIRFDRVTSPVVIISFRARILPPRPFVVKKTNRCYSH